MRISFEFLNVNLTIQIYSKILFKKYFGDAIRPQ